MFQKYKNMIVVLNVDDNINIIFPIYINFSTIQYYDYFDKTPLLFYVQ